MFRMPKLMASPRSGADDDGSGTTTVMEVLHVLTQGGYVPQSHNVEFHFYSAEEGGMLGSQAIVNDYQKKISQAHRGERVKAMLQVS
jgi:leucyl aminopeptidase